jgi:hypothetical protein
MRPFIIYGPDMTDIGLQDLSGLDIVIPVLQVDILRFQLVASADASAPRPAIAIPFKNVRLSIR